MQKSNYPELSDFFPGYFHQDWTDGYLWDSAEPSYKAIVELYIEEALKSEILAAIKELEHLLSQGYDDEKLHEVTQSLHLYLYPPGLNMTHKEWLGSVLEILKKGIQDKDDHNK